MYIHNLPQPRRIDRTDKPSAPKFGTAVRGTTRCFRIGCQSSSQVWCAWIPQEAHHTTSRKTPTFWTHATHRVEAVFRTVARNGEAQKIQDHRCASAGVFPAPSVPITSPTTHSRLDQKVLGCRLPCGPTLRSLDISIFLLI